MAVELIADMSFNFELDRLRFAIELLREAGEIAEAERNCRVAVDHVEAAHRYPIPQ